MALTIPKRVFLEMLAAARATAPLEACGLLAGTDESVARCYVLTNADASAEHYRMLPVEQFAAVKDMRSTGLKMLAIWHSHPASPARMSDEDIRLAYTPDVLYVILSLVDPSGPKTCAFNVRDGVPHHIPVMIDEKES
ncbi:MAG: M67 family metallopeptidase [bacterium]